MTTVEEFLDIYERIKVANTNILAQIDKAIEHEEHARPLEAIASYECSIRLINEAFKITVGLPDDVTPVYTQWRDACAIVAKLRRAREEMNYRLQVLRLQHANAEATDEGAAAVKKDTTTPANATAPIEKSARFENPSASGADATQPANDAVGLKNYRRILAELRRIIADPAHVGILFDTLFQTQVKLYKIQPDGVVVTMGETSMSLVMCTTQPQNAEWRHLNGVCFIQCTVPPRAIDAPQTDAPTKELPHMIWLYALLPAITNCYRTEYGAFILPDMETDEVGHAFGLILLEREDSPDSDAGAEQTSGDAQLTDLQQFFLDLLEAVLSGTVPLLQQPKPHRAPRDTSDQVSRHIVGAADFIARNLVRGAEKTGELMVKGTPYVISKMRPAPLDTPPMSSTVQTSVTVAKNVTQAAAGATGWVAGKVGAASMALGRYLAPHVQTAGTALLQKGFGYNNAEAYSKVEGAMTIAAGAVEGISTVYGGLETSAKILGNNLSENSVKIIEHKYGASAGNVAAGTFDTIGNAFNVSQNVNYITPKGFAKKMVKNTGKAVVFDYQRSLREEAQMLAAANRLYPDLRSVEKH